MIGDRLKANASFPVQDPTKTAVLLLGALFVVFYILAVFLASSVSGVV